VSTPEKETFKRAPKQPKEKKFTPKTTEKKKELTPEVKEKYLREVAKIETKFEALRGTLDSVTDEEFIDKNEYSLNSLAQKIATA
jgi:hypothetical protein